DDTGSDTLDRIERVCYDLALSIDRVSESVDHAADHRVSDRNAHDALRALHFVAFFDLLEVAEQHSTDLIFFEVERETADTVRIFQQLTGHDLFKTMDFGDSVTDLDNGADLVN